MVGAIIGDFVLERSSTTGLGPYQMSGAPAASVYHDFLTEFGSGNPCVYVSRSVTKKWEIVRGVITSGSPPSLSRGTLLKSSTGAFINWQAGDVSPDPLIIYSAHIGIVTAGAISSHRGTTAPVYATPGMIWEDITGAPTAVLLKIADASLTWIIVGTVNETANTFEAAGNYVKSDGTVPMTGPLTISTGASASELSLSANAAISKSLRFKTAGVDRWVFGQDTIAESGANAGAGFFINRYSDAGAYLATPVIINRASGLVGINEGLTVAGVINATGGVDNIGGLSQHWVSNSGGNSLHNFDANDYLAYIRASNYFQFVIGGAEVAKIDATGIVGMVWTLGGSVDISSPVGAAAVQNLPADARNLMVIGRLLPGTDSTIFNVGLKAGATDMSSVNVNQVNPASNNSGDGGVVFCVMIYDIKAGYNKMLTKEVAGFRATLFNESGVARIASTLAATEVYFVVNVGTMTGHFRVYYAK